VILGIILAVGCVVCGIWWAQKKERDRQDAYCAGYVAGKTRGESDVQLPLTHEEKLEAQEWQILHDKGLMKDSYPEWRRKQAFLKQAMSGK
jgi:hypothetical protein